MSLSPLLPVAGLTLGSLAVRAVQQLATGPSFAEMFRATPERGKSAPPTPSGPLVQLRSETQALRDHLERTTRQLLAQHGIATTPPIELRLDDAGQIVVGPHPDQALIERLFAEHPEQQDRFREWAAKSRTLREAETGGLAARDVRLVIGDEPQP